VKGGQSQACAWGDPDNDGFRDLCVANQHNEPNFPYRNSGNGNAWIKIRCVGTVSNCSAIGGVTERHFGNEREPGSVGRGPTFLFGRSAQDRVRATPWISRCCILRPVPSSTASGPYPTRRRS